jgi:hypothetical protein
MAEDPAPETVQPEEEGNPGCGLLVGWVLATVLGSGLGWAAAWGLSFAVPAGLATAALGLVMGAVLGAAQAVLLRTHLKPAWPWVLVTALAWAVGFPGGIALAYRFGWVEAVLGGVVGAVVGLLQGLLQWGLLRGQVTQAGWWILASLFGWAVALFYYRPGLSAAGLFYGLLAGIVTGVALLWLFYRPTSD